MAGTLKQGRCRVREQQGVRSTHLADQVAPDACEPARPLKHAILLGNAVSHAHLASSGRGGRAARLSRAVPAGSVVRHGAAALYKQAQQRPSSKQAPSISHRLVFINAAGCQCGNQAACRGAHQLHLAQIKVPVQVPQAAKLPPEENCRVAPRRGGAVNTWSTWLDKSKIRLAALGVHIVSLVAPDAVGAD